MNIYKYQKKIILIILVICALGLYILEGISLNLFIFWVLLPFYIGYSIIYKSLKIKSRKKLWAGYSFLLISIGFTYLYHFAWFFDWQGTATGSSTAALIFVWAPIWSVLLGYIAYFFTFYTKGNELI